MKYIPLTARILFSIIFLMAPLGHFTQQSINYAASNGVPLASFLVPASGVLAFLGALCILLGYKAKVGAWLIIAFLLPVTFMMHRFWAVDNPMMKQMQMVMFTKNLALMCGALFIAYFGAGPLSLDARGKEV